MKLMIWISASAVGLACTYWAILKKGAGVRAAVLSAALGTMFCAGYAIGESWERLRNYDAYVYRFSQYSTHLRKLVEQNHIPELTNDVLLFDRYFNPGQRASDLQNAMFQILKVGAYSTNAVRHRSGHAVAEMEETH